MAPQRPGRLPLVVHLPPAVPSCCEARPFRLDHLIVGLDVPLTDAQWARIKSLLPDRTPQRGGRWRDHREVIDAIAWKFQTGSQWTTCPRSMGTGGASTTGCECGPSTEPGSGCSPCSSRRPTPRKTSAGLSRSTPLSCALTSTQPGPQKGDPAGEPDDNAIGRSRGGNFRLTTKIHSPPMPTAGPGLRAHRRAGW
ncbi:transposase [Streptomyces sp. NPDC001273]|uniref:transposase n=1 Tax=unclassified Streptomyces TaxID=2593676 RepID=UPI0033C3EAE1